MLLMRYSIHQIHIPMANFGTNIYELPYVPPAIPNVGGPSVRNGGVVRIHKRDHVNNIGDGDKKLV